MTPIQTTSTWYQSSQPPASAAEGDIWVNTKTHDMRVKAQGSWQAIADAPQRLSAEVLTRFCQMLGVKYQVSTSDVRALHDPSGDLHYTIAKSVDGDPYWRVRDHKSQEPGRDEHLSNVLHHLILSERS